MCRHFLLCRGGRPGREGTGTPAPCNRLATVCGSMPYLAATAASECPLPYRSAASARIPLVHSADPCVCVSGSGGANRTHARQCRAGCLGASPGAARASSRFPRVKRVIGLGVTTGVVQWAVQTVDPGDLSAIGSAAPCKQLQGCRNSKPFANGGDVTGQHRTGLDETAGPGRAGMVGSECGDAGS